MTTTSFSYSISLQDLNDLKIKLNTPPATGLVELQGTFWRVEDFSQSHAQLNKQFHEELKVAHFEFPKAKSADDLHGALSKHDIQTSISGRDFFSTRLLAPALRHFINDSCRLLEPMVPLLAIKHPSVASRPNDSLNRYISRLVSANERFNFDHEYILDLYELWYDYKHRNTTGLHSTHWQYKNDKIIKAKLSPPRNLRTPLAKIVNVNIDDFVSATTKKILVFVNTVV